MSYCIVYQNGKITNNTFIPLSNYYLYHSASFQTLISAESALDTFGLLTYIVPGIQKRVVIVDEDEYNRYVNESSSLTAQSQPRYTL